MSLYNDKIWKNVFKVLEDMEGVTYKEALKIEQDCILLEKKLTENEQKTILACLYVDLVIMPCKSLNLISTLNLQNNQSIINLQEIQKNVMI